jgi:hypothetical protein
VSRPRRLTRERARPLARVRGATAGRLAAPHGGAEMRIAPADLAAEQAQ